MTAQPAGAATRTTLPRFAVTNVQVSRDSFVAHSEPAIAENPRNHDDLVAGSKMFTNPAKYEFKIGTYYSTDGGITWHDSGMLPGFTQYDTTSDISFAFSSTGVVYAAVLALGGKRSGIFVSKSTDGGQTFGAPVPVFLDTTGVTFNDKPWIAVDTTRGKFSGTIYVAWNLDGPSAREKDPDAGSSSDGDALFNQEQAEGTNIPTGLAVARSTNGGKSFSPPVIVQSFDSAVFPLGAIPAVAPDGTLHVVYSDSDNRTGLVTSLAMVTSTDGGVTFTPPQSIATVQGVPNHLGPTNFRNFSLPTFAISPHDGSMVAAWADMRNGDADIYATTSLDGGATWSAPYRVNHDRIANGKDQFQPALAVSPDGTYTCAWFDRRHDPNNVLIDEELAQSTSDGLTFGHNFRVTKHSWNPAIDAPLPEGKKNNTFIGDYQALAVDNSTVHPLWNDTQNGRSQEIETAVVSVRMLRKYEAKRD